MGIDPAAPLPLTGEASIQERLAALERQAGAIAAIRASVVALSGKLNAPATVTVLGGVSRPLNTPFQPNLSRPTLVVAMVGDAAGTEQNATLSMAAGAPNPATDYVAGQTVPAGGEGTLVAIVPAGWYYQLTRAFGFTQRVTEYQL